MYKDVKYMYWVKKWKKWLVWVILERGDTWQRQWNRFERGRINRNVNYSASITRCTLSSLWTSLFFLSFYCFTYLHLFDVQNLNHLIFVSCNTVHAWASTDRCSSTAPLSCRIANIQTLNTRVVAKHTHIFYFYR